MNSLELDHQKVFYFCNIALFANFTFVQSVALIFFECQQKFAFCKTETKGKNNPGSRKFI